MIRIQVVMKNHNNHKNNKIINKVKDYIIYRPL